MTSFSEFLRKRIDESGFSTEDVLHAIIPLLEQVSQDHQRERVAPLEGINDLAVADGQIWYEETRHKAPTRNAEQINRLDTLDRKAIEVVASHRQSANVDDGEGHAERLDVAERGRDITQPVHLPGYISWEHEVGHHDPLTDIYVLGLVLASLSCGLDFQHKEDLDLFVRHRENLFKISSAIHPVIAKVVVSMTELSRHKRINNLDAVIQFLRNYKEQDAGIDIELLQIEGFEDKELHDKQQIILNKLQQRLFDISKRNRLYHFRPNMQSVNLTHSSVPLSFSVENIRAEEILTWGEALHNDIIKEKPISLNKHLNFHEILFLPGVLDRIRIEAAKDKKEYGFAQLRLVVCFISWSNLKESGRERINSPLVLVPVDLVKKKGVRDTYYIRPLDSEAEINPVLRHQFKELYNVRLPERIDLRETNLDVLFENLRQQINASEPGVTLNKVTRPRIDLIHSSVKRRLDQYKRKARLSGRGVRKFLDVDYSYDASNFNPLGIRLFNEYVRPPVTHVKRIVSDAPILQTHMVEVKEKPEATRERQFYRIREDEIDNPYVWEFDLCNVTLGNFKYRKMSLVRDYTDLIEGPRESLAFESTFSLQARKLQSSDVEGSSVEKRFHIVPCDPTQAEAIEFAGSGESYIIQGPPGTGKSQTITNLIADYILRGKRVLFVCEKRAAIDVVYLRLKQRGLDPLCCLIHDSQEDKKSFVMDLKATYERFLAAEQPDGVVARRQQIVSQIQESLLPLKEYGQRISSIDERAGTSLHELMQMLVESPDEVGPADPVILERFPDYSLWIEAGEQLGAFRDLSRPMLADGLFCNHPLRLLAPQVVEMDMPQSHIRDQLVSGNQAIERLLASLESAGTEVYGWTTVEDLVRGAAYATQLSRLVEWKLTGLLINGHSDGKMLERIRRKVRSRQSDLEETRRKNRHWRHKLNAEDTLSALTRAMSYRTVFRFLIPGFWKLRGVLKRSYDFFAHEIRPDWVTVLQQLKAEHDAQAAITALDRDAREELGHEGSVEQLEDYLEECSHYIAALDQDMQAVHKRIIESSEPGKHLAALLDVAEKCAALQQELDGILVDYARLSPLLLKEELHRLAAFVQTDLTEPLFMMRAFSRLPAALASCFRHEPLTYRQIKLTLAQRSLHCALGAERSLHQYSGATRHYYVQQLQSLYRKWLDSNAAVILDMVQARFVENVRVSSLPAAQLAQDQKEFKRRYNKGRRELEHEFSKSMRYRPIRDIVADESGDVVKDLKPVWLMSPLSVSDSLPLDGGYFDVVIFDEASQVTLEEAIPSIFRAPQAIVVGDQMQLPPTSFFASRRDDEDELLLENEEGELVEYDLNSNSFLNHASKNLESRMLGWHYRSRSEHLISFSNWSFYDSQLLTVPDERLPPQESVELSVKDAASSADLIHSILNRAISFLNIKYGIYEQRRNRDEAECIAEIVRALLQQEDKRSIGIIAFSEAQQGEIESALSRLASQDEDFARALEAEYDREEDGEFVGLLVKNLENIQGDERDVIILSVCYGYNRQGKMRMNFGPINQSGGEKRLNVAFSRAKHHMVIVSSIRSDDITNDYNDGANCLKNYLRYADAISSGDMQAVRNLQRGMTTLSQRHQNEVSGTDSVTEQISKALSEHGYIVDQNVGQSHFTCDLGVRKAGDEAYRLGILVDTSKFYEQTDVLEREFQKPNILKVFGWKVEFVLGKDWYSDREVVLERLLAVLGDDAVSAGM